MALAGTHHEIEDLGGGLSRHTQYVKRIGYMENGSPKRMVFDLGASGDANYPVGVANGDLYFRLDKTLAGKSPLMTFGKGQSRVTLALLGANNVSGTVSGQVVTFANAWNNADLTLTYGGHILRKDILLKAGHPSQFAFRVDDHANFDPATLRFADDFYIVQPSLHNPATFESVGLAWDVTQSGGKYILTCVLPPGDYAGWTLDPTLTLQPDATDGVDTVIYKGEITFNYGISTTTWGGRGGSVAVILRGLVKFNLSSLPVGASVTSATLTLYCTSESSTTNYDVNIHRALTQWYEGLKAGAAPDAGQDGSTWSLRNYNGAVPWAGGAGGASGSDWTAIATDSTTITAPATAFDWDGLADVQAWAGGANNYGWWLIGNEGVVAL